MIPLLETREIKLRAIEPEDINLLYEWENNPHVWNVSNTFAPFSKKVLKDYLDNAHLDIFTTKQLRLVIELKSKYAVGFIDIFDYDPFHLRAGIGILIASEEKRRNGYASQSLDLVIQYASEVLRLNQLYCNISINNVASINLFEKHGFSKTGIRKNWLNTKSGFIDEVFMQLLF